MVSGIKGRLHSDDGGRTLQIGVLNNDFCTPHYSAFFIWTYLVDVLCETTGSLSIGDGNSNENATIKNLIGRLMMMMRSMVIMMTSSEAAMMMNCR